MQNLLVCSNAHALFCVDNMQSLSYVMQREEINSLAAMDIQKKGQTEWEEITWLWLNGSGFALQVGEQPPPSDEVRMRTII